MLESAITTDEGTRLLRLARRAIVSAVEGGPRPELLPSELTPGIQEFLGAFVTLYHGEELRGCIGRMQYDTPLHRNVIEAAISSALGDPRFPPVEKRELSGLALALSILDEPHMVDGYEEFEPEEHGIVMELGILHGTFLPKVARESSWDRAQTLTMLCRKIGVSDDAWRRPDAKFKIYHAIEFVENG